MSSTKTRLREIAKLANVSVATVSRIMTGSARVSPEVRERVMRAAAEIGINVTWPSKSRIITFLLCNRDMLHPFHSHVLAEAEAHCSGNDWRVLFLTLTYSPTAGWRNLLIPRLVERRDLVSGFILAGTNYQNLLDRLNHEGLPFAVLGNNVLGNWHPEKYDVVWFDDVQGAVELTRYLLSLGHRDIWFVGNTQLTWFGRRYTGYCQAMREVGLEPHLSEVEAEREQDIGYLAAKSLLARNLPVSAIFAGGDLAAEGVCRALRDCGRRIPEDVSVAGFDDVVATLLHPPLTTVHVFTEQIGKKLAQMVLNRIEHPSIEPQQATIPTQLVRRESCLPLGGSREAPVGEHVEVG